MEENFETVDEIEAEEQLQEKKSFWEKTKEVGKNVGEILIKNPMLIVPVVSGALGIAGKIISMFLGGSKTWNTHYMSEDDVTGEEFRLRHPLSNSEILELGEKMIDGQTKGEALENMGLLKNERRRRG